MEEFPPNSDKSKRVETDEKKVERVTSSEPIRRKKGLGSKFKSTFFGGDAKSAAQYVLFGVLVPAAKEAIADAGREGIERLVFGDSRRKHNAPPSGPQGYVTYNKYAMGGQGSVAAPRALSRRARSQHDFDEIVLTSRQEADEVIDNMYEIVSRYEAVTVSDLYDLVGLQSTHTDNKWGWVDLRGAGVSRVKDGFLLDLPAPDPLTN